MKWTQEQFYEWLLGIAEEVVPTQRKMMKKLTPESYRTGRAKAEACLKILDSPGMAESVMELVLATSRLGGGGLMALSVAHPGMETVILALAAIPLLDKLAQMEGIIPASDGASVGAETPPTAEVPPGGGSAG